MQNNELPRASAGIPREGHGAPIVETLTEKRQHMYKGALPSYT